MLGVICGLMVMGCPTEDKNKEEENPLGGKVIEEKYRGTWSTTSNYNYKMILTENKMINYDASNEFTGEYWAYTEGNKLYFYRNKNFFIGGVFTEDSKFQAYMDGQPLDNTWIYTKNN